MRPRSPIAISFFLLIVIAALLFLAAQNQSQIKIFQDLKVNGRAMQARVLKVERRRSSRNGWARYRIQYDYQIGKAGYDASARIDKNEFQTFKVGDRIPITYAVDHPGISTFKPSAQIDTERLEQIFSILGALAAITWLVFEMRRGTRDGWRNA